VYSRLARRKGRGGGKLGNKKTFKEKHYNIIREKNYFFTFTISRV
jgi:hypothetical protein